MGIDLQRGFYQECLIKAVSTIYVASIDKYPSMKCKPCWIIQVCGCLIAFCMPGKTLEVRDHCHFLKYLIQWYTNRSWYVLQSQKYSLTRLCGSYRKMKQEVRVTLPAGME